MKLRYILLHTLSLFLLSLQPKNIEAQTQQSLPAPQVGSAIARLKLEHPREEYIDCKCYCSVKCGERISTSYDTPFWDPIYEKCFCKQRDKENYVHNCYLNEDYPLDPKPIQAPNLPSCCDGK